MTPDEKLEYEKIKSNPKEYLFNRLFRLNKEGKAEPLPGIRFSLLNGIPFIEDIPKLQKQFSSPLFDMQNTSESDILLGINSFEEIRKEINSDNPLGKNSIFYTHKLFTTPPSNKTEPESGSTQTTENYYKIIKCSSGTEVFEKHRTEKIPPHSLYIFIEENNPNTSNFFGTACRVKFGEEFSISPQSLLNNANTIVYDSSLSENSTNSLAEFAKTIFTINHIKENPAILENAIKLEILEQSPINKQLEIVSRLNNKLAEWISSGVEKLENYKLKEQNYDYETYYLIPVYNRKNGFSDSAPTYNPIILVTLFNKQDTLVANGIRKLKEMNQNLSSIIFSAALPSISLSNPFGIATLPVLLYLQENLPSSITQPLEKLKGMITLTLEFLSRIPQWATEKAAELNAFLCGLINGVISLVQTILSLLAMVVENTSLSSLFSGLSRMQEMLEFVEDFTDLVQENLVLIFTELKNFLLDKKNWKELKNFIIEINKKIIGLNKYFWAFFVGQILFEVILDTVITYFTGGTSLAAKTMSKIRRSSTQTEKLAKNGIHLDKNTVKKTADSLSSLLRWLKQEFEELIRAIRNKKLVHHLKIKFYRILGKTFEEVVEYGIAELSQQAINFRKTLPNPGHNGNIAVFEFYDKNSKLQTKAFSTEKGINYHAEKIGLWWIEKENIPKENVIRIYSELEPCNLDRHSCKKLIKDHFKNANIEYSFPYPGSNQSSLADFRKRKQSLKTRKSILNKFFKK